MAEAESVCNCQLDQSAQEGIVAVPDHRLLSERERRGAAFAEGEAGDESQQ